MSLRPKIGFTQYRGHELIEAPETEPVTADELREHLRLDDNGDDSYLEMLITSAREQFESISARALIKQKWRLTLDRWPMQRGEPWWDGVQQGAITELLRSGDPGIVFLPKYKLLEVDGVRTFDQAGNASEVDLDIFIEDTRQEPGRLVLRSTSVWPVALQRANAVEIDYYAGYGEDAKDVPAALRLGLLQFAGFMYENRGDCPAEEAMRKSGASATFNRYTVARV